MRTEGVGKVSVDPDRNTAEVVYDNSVTSIDVITKRLSDKGYPPESTNYSK